MSHSFGDRLSQHLHRKHGLSQAKLAEGILQDPSIIGKMCKGQRLNGPQARERVCAIIGWLRQQSVLTTVDEANQLLIAADMAPLSSAAPAEQALLQQLSQQPSPQPPPAKPLRRSTNLPASLTSFVGRRQEVTEVSQFVATQRLVTLTGAGGVGKTRLALEVGKTIWSGSIQNTKFLDGVWVVELAALPKGDSGPMLVAQTITQLFHCQEQAGQTPLAAIEEYLADKHLLLVLDNCEHLVAACAEVSERLLQRCWQLHILATSREELRIPGETLYPVLSLALPSPTEQRAMLVLEAASVQLFVERMQGSTPGAKVPETELATVAHICRQLDGIPLALELAAPLTRSHSLTEIAHQLDNQMALLTNSYRTAIPRHQTMHSALIWSYRLLSSEEQQVLAKASVFAGGWTLEAAHAVCVDAVSPPITPAYVAALLNQLIAKSWVLTETVNDQRRYRLLEPVRQFAHTHLVASGEQEETQRCHAHYFLGLAKQMDRARDTPQEREWLQRLEPERNNLQTVNRWAFAGKEVEFAQRFNGLLFAFWIYCSSLTEASHWLEGALALQSAQNAAVRTLDALRVEAAALDAAGYTAVLGFDFARAQALFMRELNLRRELGEAKGIAQALRGISFIFMLSNNLDQAQIYEEQALTLARAEQDRWGVAWALYDLGYLALVRGELDDAHALLAEALPRLQEHGINFGVFRTLLALGHVMRFRGDNVQSHQFYTNALRLQQQMHYFHWIAEGLEGLATIATEIGDLTRAVHLFGAAHAHRQASGLARLYHQEADYERALAFAHSQLDSATWDATWAAGCALSLEQAVEYALIEQR